MKKRKKKKKIDVYKKLLKKLNKSIKTLEKESSELWRRSVYERDNYCCLICGKYLEEGNKHNCQAHHIIDKKNHPQFKYDVMNGITLCYYDHKNSSKSPHLNALVFIELLKERRFEQYSYLLNLLKRSENIV
jgi:5-methylcytosine-specific restriction endonuclease McrA